MNEIIAIISNGGILAIIAALFFKNYNEDRQDRKAMERRSYEQQEKHNEALLGVVKVNNDALEDVASFFQASKESHIEMECTLQEILDEIESVKSQVADHSTSDVKIIQGLEKLAEKVDKLGKQPEDRKE